MGKILSFALAFVIILRIKGPHVKSLTKPSLSLESSDENYFSAFSLETYKHTKAYVYDPAYDHVSLGQSVVANYFVMFIPGLKQFN